MVDSDMIPLIRTTLVALSRMTRMRSRIHRQARTASVRFTVRGSPAMPPPIWFIT